jgi:hypothetical protein
MKTTIQKIIQHAAEAAHAKAICPLPSKRNLHR